MTTTAPTRHSSPAPDDHGVDAHATEAAWRIVAGREIMVKLRDRNFIISTVTTVAIFIIAFGASFLLGGDDDEKKIVVTSGDAAAIVQQIDAQADAADDEDTDQAATAGPPTIQLSVDQVADQAEAEQAVRDGDADVALLGGPGAWTLVGSEDVDPGIAAAVSSAIAADALERNAAAAGTTVADLTAGSVVQERLLDADGANDEGVQVIAGFVFVFLFYMAAILFGYAIANSVVEEKQSRIVEILAAAIPLQQLLVGKVIGATVLALGQMVIFVGIGLIGLSFTDYATLLPSVAGAAAWYLVLFAIGFVALACLFAVAGAMATRAEDVQTTTSPLLTIIMVVFFGGLFLKGTWQVIASYVPIMSTVAMPIRLVAGTASWWEPIIATLLTLASAVVIIRIAERVYRRSIMQTGRKLSYREALSLSE